MRWFFIFLINNFNNMARWSEDTTMKFVQEYLKHDCLWDVRNEQYKNRQKRQLAYSKIDEVMAIQGFGQKEIVQKIKNIRSTYSQELKKINDSKHSGDGADELYTPSLKWFRILDNVLKLVAESTRKTQTNMVTDNDVTGEESQTTEGSQTVEKDAPPVDTPATPSSHGPPNKRKKVQELRGLVTELKGISESINKPLEEENEFELFGRTIGVQLQKMPLALALEAQDHIQTYLTRFRLQHLQNTPSSSFTRSTLLRSPLQDYSYSSPATPASMYSNNSESLGSQNILSQALAGVLNNFEEI